MKRQRGAKALHTRSSRDFGYLLKKANQIKIKAAKSEHPITYSGRPCERSGFFKCVRAFSKLSGEPVAFFVVLLVFLPKYHIIKIHIFQNINLGTHRTSQVRSLCNFRFKLRGTTNVIERQRGDTNERSRQERHEQKRLLYQLH